MRATTFVLALAAVTISQAPGGKATASAKPPSAPDPTLLPVARGQRPNVTAYAALDVPNQPAGFSYNDPVSGVKVWKATSNTVPAVSTGKGTGHDYSDGPNEVSLGWGPNNNTHTILIGAPPGS